MYYLFYYSGVTMGRRRGVQQPGPATGRARGGAGLAVFVCQRPHPRAEDTRALDQTDL